MVHSQNFYKQYQETFEKYTELYGEHICVFLLKGSFYELYGIYDPVLDKHENTVKQVADILDLQLKVYPNDVTGGKTGLFGGVPEHTIHKWAGKLGSLGWTSILIDQVKSASGEVTDRKVARVISPGTHVECSEEDESMYVVSIWINATAASAAATIGVAAAECSIGDVIHFEQEATGTLQSWHADSTAQFISTFQPKEVILNWNGNPIHCPEENTLRILFEIPQHVPLYIRIKDKPTDSEFIREEYMRKCFSIEGMLPIRVVASLTGSNSLAEYALIELLKFIENHDTTLIEKLHGAKRWNPDESMAVLNHAMEQLNIKSPTSDFTVENLFNKCMTAIGKRHFKQRLQTPFSCSDKIVEQHTSISWVLGQDLTTRRSLETCLRSMCDIARLHRQITRGQLTHETAQQVAKTLDSMLLLIRQLRESPIYNGQAEEAITLCIEAFRANTDWNSVQQYTSESDPYINWLSTSISPLATEAYKNLESVRKDADKWLRAFENFAGIQTGSLSFKSGDSSRYQLTITKTQHKNIKQTSAERYVYKTMSSSVKVESSVLDSIHDKTVALENKFKTAFSRELAYMCIDYCKKTRDTWKPIEEWVASTDIIITHASIVEKYGLVRPEIQPTDDSQPSEVSIEALRHPLIEAQKTRVKYVTHDIHIGSSTCGILLYGINASGKSSLMKAIGIAVILAQCGLFVPAISMSLRPFKTIATRILNHDNIAQGMSSFTVEMSELREILRIADHRTLVLGDEVCAGTESVSGTAIVAATLDHLLTKQSRFMFATHLHDLLKCDDIIQNPSLKVFHLHVEYDPISDTLIYNRSLMPGNGKAYYGLEVAKALHIPIGILEKAYSIRAKLLGEGSSTSHWNSNQILESCEICKNGIHSKLEVHHIKPRKDATNKRNEDGSALNDLRNLITVCQGCHDKHHAKELEIKEVIQTSKGEQRRIIKVPVKKNIHKKYTEEQQQTIRKCIIENPGVAPNLLLIKLKLDYEIDITNKDIKSFY